MTNDDIKGRVIALLRGEGKFDKAEAAKDWVRTVAFLAQGVPQLAQEKSRTRYLLWLRVHKEAAEEVLSADACEELAPVRAKLPDLTAFLAEHSTPPTNEAN